MKVMTEASAEAPIVHAVSDLYREFYAYAKLFPKKDQYLLGRRCEDALLSFIGNILRATGTARGEKLHILQTASADFEVLKLLLRLARELKLLDSRKYLSLETRIREIGRMLGGWMKSLPRAA